jgi:hypothetical protein
MSFYLRQATTLAQQQQESPIRQPEVKVEDYYPTLSHTPEEIELLVLSTLGGNLEPSFDVIRDYRAQQKQIRGTEGSQLAPTAASPTVSMNWTQLTFPRTHEHSASDAIYPPTKYQDVKRQNLKARPSLPKYPDCACVRDDGGREIVPKTYEGDWVVVVKDYFTPLTIDPHSLHGGCGIKLPGRRGQAVAREDPQAPAMVQQVGYMAQAMPSSGSQVPNAAMQAPASMKQLPTLGQDMPIGRQQTATGAQTASFGAQKGVTRAQQQSADGQSLPAGGQRNRIRNFQTTVVIEPVPSSNLPTALGDHCSALSCQMPQDACTLPANGKSTASSDLLATLGRQYRALPCDVPQNEYTQPAPGYSVPSGDLPAPFGGQHNALNSVQTPVSGQRLSLSGQHAPQNEPMAPRRRGRPRKDPNMAQKMSYIRRKKPDQADGAEQPCKKPKTATAGAKTKPPGVGDTIIATPGRPSVMQADKLTPQNTPLVAYARAQEAAALPDVLDVEHLAPLFQVNTKPQTCA